MQTLKAYSGIYKGKKTVEVLEDIHIKENSKVLILISEESEEDMIKKNLMTLSENIFKKTWNNKEDEIWNEYL